MNFKAISFSLVAAAAILAQPAFAAEAGSGALATSTVGGVALPVVGFTVVAATTLVASKKDTTTTATSTATATK